MSEKRDHEDETEEVAKVWARWADWCDMIEDRIRVWKRAKIRVEEYREAHQNQTEAIDGCLVGICAQCGQTAELNVDPADPDELVCDGCYFEIKDSISASLGW